MSDKDNFIVDTEQEYLEVSKFMGAANVNLKMKLDVTENGDVRVRKIKSGGDLSSWSVQPDFIPRSERKKLLAESSGELN